MINIQKSHSVHFGPFGPHWSNSIHFGSIRSTLIVHSVHFSPIRVIRSYSVNFCSIQSTLVLFSLSWSYLFLFSPLHPFCSQFVCPFLFSPISSALFPFGPILSIRSTSFHLVQFGPFMSTSVHFCALTYREKTCLGESNFSKSKFINIYIYIYQTRSI